MHISRRGIAYLRILFHIFIHIFNHVQLVFSNQISLMVGLTIEYASSASIPSRKYVLITQSSVRFQFPPYLSYIIKETCT